MHECKMIITHHFGNLLFSTIFVVLYFTEGTKLTEKAAIVDV